MSLVTASHIGRQTLRLLIVSLVGATTVNLAFAYLPGWLAWGWAIAVGVLWLTDLGRLGVLLWVVAADRQSGRGRR